MRRILIVLIILLLSFSVASAQTPQPSEEELWSQITSLYTETTSVKMTKFDQSIFDAYQKNIVHVFDQTTSYEQQFPEGKYKQENRNLLVISLCNQVGGDKYSFILSDRFNEFLEDTTLSREAEAAVLTIEASGRWNKVESRVMEFLKKNPDLVAAYGPVYVKAMNLEYRDMEKALELYALCTTCPDERIRMSSLGILKRETAENKPFTMKFTAIDGRKVDIKKLKSKYVLIDFWATWCGPCIGSLPGMKELYAKWHSKGLEIIGISADEDYSKLTAFIQENQIPWPQYFDQSGFENQFMQEWGIIGIPALFLVDKKGILISTKMRGNEKILEELLQGKNYVKKENQSLVDEYFSNYKEHQKALNKYIQKAMPNPKHPLVVLPYLEDTSRLAFKIQYLPFYLDKRYVSGGIACVWDNKPQLVSRRVVDQWTLPELLYNLGFSKEDIQGDKSLLEQKFKGDFHLLKGATLESIKPDLEKGLRTILKKPVKLSLQTTPRKFIVLKGTYQYSGFSQVTTGEIICITNKEPDEQSYIIPQKGTLSDVASFLSAGADIPVVIQLEGGVNPAIQYWLDTLTTKDNLNQVLDNLIRQTGLTKTEEVRQVPVLTIH